MDERDLPWARRGGRLNAADRWRLVLEAVSARLAQRLRRSPRGSDPRQVLDPRALDTLAMPASAWAARVHDAAAAAQPEWLMQHGLRTYAWARLLARGSGVAHDDGVLYAAALLHDLGLTAAAAEPPQDCFAVRGARASAALLRSAGASPQQCHAVAAAIARHLAPVVPLRHGAEAHLLNAGAGLDVTGARRHEIPVPLRDEVLRRHPRGPMKVQLCQCLQQETAQAPQTRLALYVGRYGFLERIARAPFES